MKATKSLIAFAIAASALINVSAHAGIFDVQPKIFGAPAAASAAQRTVDVTPDTKQISVTNGETVQFNVDGKSFTWHFDLYHDDGVVDLATLAPQDFKAGGVKVVVAENPLYRELYRN
jgi:hypothetical protein